jgi:hypothetical protein
LENIFQFGNSSGQDVLGSGPLPSVGETSAS